MNELIEAIKSKRGPGGDLYLTKTHADHLIRWMEICEESWKQGEAAVKELQTILKLTRGKNEGTNSSPDSGE